MSAKKLNFAATYNIVSINSQYHEAIDQSLLVNINQ